MSVRLSACNSAPPTGRIYVKFDTGDCYKNTSRKPKFGQNRTKEIHGNLLIDLWRFYCFRQNKFAIKTLLYNSQWHAAEQYTGIALLLIHRNNKMFTRTRHNFPLHDFINLNKNWRFPTCHCCHSVIFWVSGPNTLSTMFCVKVTHELSNLHKITNDFLIRWSYPFRQVKGN